VSYMYDMVVKDIKCFASVICVLTHGLVSEHQTVGYIFTSFVYSHAGAGARIMRAINSSKQQNRYSSAREITKPKGAPSGAP